MHRLLMRVVGPHFTPEKVKSKLAAKGLEACFLEYPESETAVPAAQENGCQGEVRLLITGRSH